MGFGFEFRFGFGFRITDECTASKNGSSVGVSKVNYRNDNIEISVLFLPV